MVDELTTNDETGHAVDFTVQALFLCVFKKSQGHFAIKKLNLLEAISDFTKKNSRNFLSELQFFMGVTSFRSFLLTNIYFLGKKM